MTCTKPYNTVKNSRSKRGASLRRQRENRAPERALELTGPSLTAQELGERAQASAAEMRRVRPIKGVQRTDDVDYALCVAAAHGLAPLASGCGAMAAAAAAVAAAAAAADSRVPAMPPPRTKVPREHREGREGASAAPGARRPPQGAPPGMPGALPGGLPPGSLPGTLPRGALPPQQLADAQPGVAAGSSGRLHAAAGAPLRPLRHEVVLCLRQRDGATPVIAPPIVEPARFEHEDDLAADVLVRRWVFAASGLDPAGKHSLLPVRISQLSRTPYSFFARRPLPFIVLCSRFRPTPAKSALLIACLAPRPSPSA